MALVNKYKQLSISYITFFPRPYLGQFFTNWRQSRCVRNRLSRRVYLARSHPPVLSVIFAKKHLVARQSPSCARSSRLSSGLFSSRIGSSQPHSSGLCHGTQFLPPRPRYLRLGAPLTLPWLSGSCYLPSTPCSLSTSTPSVPATSYSGATSISFCHAISGFETPQD
jgi:hypothetical protein